MIFHMVVVSNKGLKVDRHYNKNKRVELFHSNIMVTYSSSHFELLVDGLNEM